MTKKYRWNKVNKSRMGKIRQERQFHPAQFLAVSFAFAILAGTVLLLLPISTVSGQISLIDAFFTATSSVCVTGLIVQDTSAFFSPFGQTVILLLFQLGGLGIMTFSTIILLAAGKKISIKDRIIIQEDFHHSALKDVKSLIRNIFLFALTLEGIGTLIFFLQWKGRFSFPRSLFLSVFHSVSAFCNAGFSVFSDSFESFRDDLGINLTLVFLIVLGGLGFLVLLEGKDLIFGLFRKKKPRLSLHVKLILSMTFLLILGSFILFLVIEWGHSLAGLSLGKKILYSLFHVVTPRTAGFNTMNLNSLSMAAVFLLILLMFIGASPGSTGGGVKTSTIGVILAFVRSRISARETVSLFYRTLPLNLITKAFTLVSLAICIIFFTAFILFLTQPDANMQEVFFESFSAFGTVGLSLGLTSKLTPVGKIVIILAMYTGRIGPLTLLYAFSRRRAFGKYEYVEENVMVG